jgi:hypothetical protein
MAKLSEIINTAIQDNEAENSKLSKGPVFIPARTYFSPTDVYEDQIGPDIPTHGFQPGHMRGMWAVNEQQQASVPVTAITSSGNSTSGQLAAIQGGIAQNPIAPATVWSAIPSMIVNLDVKGPGPVLIHANVSVDSSSANDTVGFALYRDGKLLGNHLTHTLGPGSDAGLVQMSAIDNPPVGFRVYAMYWSPGTGTLVANSNQRNIYAACLTPQG